MSPPVNSLLWLTVAAIIGQDPVVKEILDLKGTNLVKKKAKQYK